MLKFGVGALVIGSVWFVGENNRLICVVVDLLSIKPWRKFKIDTVLMSTSSDLSKNSSFFSSFYVWLYH